MWNCCCFRIYPINRRAKVVRNPGDAISYLKEKGFEEIIRCGGTNIFNEFLERDLVTDIYFNGVDFKYSDLRGLYLDGQTFIGVRFNKAALNEASFKGATLKNVSFRSSYVLTNKYYRAIQTIHFGGAMMDKLTYVALKGLGADLTNVTII